MVDFSESKKFGTKAYPVESNETTSLFGRIEPLLTPDLLVSRYLKAQKKFILDKYTQEELKQEINLATNDFELLTNLNVTQIQFRERLPFDRALYKSFVYIKTNHGPILSVDELSIESSNGENIYSIPAAWLETGYMHKRQINIIPILTVFGAAGLTDGQPSNAGLIFIQAIQNFAWLPSFFTVKYTAGLCHEDGKVPIVVNQIIGMMAAIAILSDLQSSFIHTSTSISQDGISQAAGGQGPQTYQSRIEELEQKKERLMQRLRGALSSKYYLSNI